MALVKCPCALCDCAGWHEVCFLVLGPVFLLNILPLRPLAHHQLPPPQHPPDHLPLLIIMIVITIMIIIIIITIIIIIIIVLIIDIMSSLHRAVSFYPHTHTVWGRLPG